MKYRLVEPADDIRTRSGKRYVAPTYRTVGEVLKNKKEIRSTNDFFGRPSYKPHIQMK